MQMNRLSFRSTSFILCQTNELERSKIIENQIKFQNLLAQLIKFVTYNTKHRYTPLPHISKKISKNNSKYSFPKMRIFFTIFIFHFIFFKMCWKVPSSCKLIRYKSFSVCVFLSKKTQKKKKKTIVMAAFFAFFWV
jgi:hypothetical protein